MRKERRSARQINLHRRSATLLAAVEIDGAVYLGLKPRHHGAANLGNAIQGFILVLHHAAHGNVCVCELVALGLLYCASEILRDFLGDGSASHGDRAIVKLFTFNDGKRSGLSADIHHHNALIGICRISLYKIRNRNGSDAHDFRIEPRHLDGGGDALHLLDFGSHNQDGLVAVFRVAKNLMARDHLVDRERNVLLDVAADERSKLLRVAHHRNRHSAQERHLPGNGNGHLAGPNALLAHDALNGRHENHVGVAGVNIGRKSCRAIFKQMRCLRAYIILGKNYPCSPDIEC